jgi:hypothetical protein
MLQDEKRKYEKYQPGCSHVVLVQRLRIVFTATKRLSGSHAG